MAKSTAREVNIEVTPAKRNDEEGYLITYRGNYYFCCNQYWNGLSRQPWRNTAMQQDMVQVNKDFGGLGRNALKRQDLPLIVFLNDGDKCIKLRKPTDVQVLQEAAS